MNDIYTDGVGNIHVTGNLVRFDLITLQPNLQSENGQPVYNMNQRLIMPLEAFVQAFMLQDSVVKKLIEAGVIKNDAIAPGQNEQK
jgi:hypothetical protein